jgi:hypothetical protein
LNRCQCVKLELNVFQWVCLQVGGFDGRGETGGCGVVVGETVAGLVGFGGWGGSGDGGGGVHRAGVGVAGGGEQGDGGEDVADRGAVGVGEAVVGRGAVAVAGGGMTDSTASGRSLYRNGKRFRTATLNTARCAERFGLELGGCMPQSVFRVWFVLVAMMRKNNYVRARLQEIATGCGVSLSTVHRAMQYLEAQDVLVRESAPHQDGVWLMNPELVWNSRHEEHEKWLGYYQSLRKQKHTAVEVSSTIESGEKI